MREVYLHRDSVFTLECHPLEKACGRGAVIICPGGGYQRVSQREGGPVAHAFNQAGYHAFVLHYTVDPPPLAYGPLRQLAAAVRYVRDNAAQWGVAPVQVAVCGFSAGGHLAASLGTLWKTKGCFDGDCDLHLHRPDAMVLAYPVITAGEHRHEGSFQRLCGEQSGLREVFSLERQIGPHVPPAFLWHTADDATVPVENSLLFWEAMRRAGREAEMHLYPKGVHGLSLATPDVAQPQQGRHADAHVASWFKLAVQWLDNVLGG